MTQGAHVETEWASVRATCRTLEISLLHGSQRDVPGHRGLHEKDKSLHSLHKVCCTLLQLFLMPLGSEVPLQINLKVWRFVVSEETFQVYQIFRCEIPVKRTFTYMCQSILSLEDLAIELHCLIANCHFIFIITIRIF